MESKKGKKSFSMMEASGESLSLECNDCKSYIVLDNADGDLQQLNDLTLSYPLCSDCEEEEVLCESERLKHLEDEQEQLNASLIALTSHFAQVQFRLKQIGEASPEEKENLLKELEEFAFRGIPDIREYENGLDLTQIINEQKQEQKLEQQRTRQKELMKKLKEQLEDLEHYAYETGEAGMPQSMLLERQSVIIEQIKGKLLLNLDELDKLSPDELRSHVDAAIRELVNPAKMKEQLVSQLKTQITDLERFIEFLQGEATTNGKPRCTCDCPVHRKSLHAHSDSDSHSDNGRNSMKNQNSDRSVAHIVRRVLTLLQMFTITQFGCGRHRFQKNTLKKSNKVNHWGDLRANLEVAVNEVLKHASEQEPPFEDSDYTSDTEDVPVVQCNEKLTTSVRKDLASAIRDLIQHGLMPIGQSSSLVPFGCFAVQSTAPKMMHAWDLILKYYELKNGYQYNASPARKLCQSFNLEIVGGVVTTPKQSLLSAIDNIISTHTPLKRSPDSHFKAFICAALNEKHLVQWLKLIYKTRILLERFYQPWSYAAKTGFEDALKSLEKLGNFDFDLPVDLAVRQLQSIKDAF
ncbi:RUN domain-containing protein 1 [Trichonephila clavata]|uniref:RUN domain-containing protein 1 n=1 Tax=Trichonephila clavata TaxID=2740835 RepID=A0A8X6FUJ1_TRICU|nr:RUN domain-containing protein 1 [Trichonephila clavata]